MIGLVTSRGSDRLISGYQHRVVQTPFGDVDVMIGEIAGRRTACVERYGPDLTIPSHKVNYRANMFALRSLGVRRIVSQNAIGSLNPLIPPGHIVVPDDFLDRSHQRVMSFFDDYDAWVRVDMTNPFCPELRKALISGASAITSVVDGGVFASVEGPRLETPAEVRALRQEGGDIVGTPLVPEVILARESESCFASISPVINFAAGIAESVSHTSMNSYYYTSGLHEAVEDAIAAAVLELPDEARCKCQYALGDAYFGEKPAWLPDWTWPLEDQ